MKDIRYRFQMEASPEATFRALVREDAIRRLHELVESAAFVAKLRRPTRPTRGSQTRRLDSKTRRGAIKALRGKTGE